MKYCYELRPEGLVCTGPFIPVDLQKLCKERFPETQIEGTCSIKRCDEEKVIFEFTPSKPISDINDVILPIQAEFVQQLNGKLHFHVFLRYGSFTRFFSYKSSKSKGCLRPFRCPFTRQLWKELPPEILSLPWISRIIYTAQQVWDVLHI